MATIARGVRASREQSAVSGYQSAHGELIIGTPPHPLPDEPPFTFSVETTSFKNYGHTCAARFYRPDAGRNPPPVVIMANGFGAEMSFGLAPFAEHFAAAGIAVFLFEYRYFGESEGMPRNFVSPKDHLSDWRAAIRHVRWLHDVDTERIALWGTSLSGAHVLTLAIEDRSIAAVIAQAPYVDGLSFIRRRGFAYVTRALRVAFHDALYMVAGKQPYYIPIAASPTDFGVMNTQESLPGFRSLIPMNATWENRCPARVFFPLMHYRPITLAGEIRCPALLVRGQHDSLVDPRIVYEAVKRIPKGTLITIPAGHFDLYRGRHFKTIIAEETAFLRKHLLND